MAQPDDESVVTPWRDRRATRRSMLHAVQPAAAITSIAACQPAAASAPTAAPTPPPEPTTAPARTVQTFKEFGATSE